MRYLKAALLVTTCAAIAPLDVAPAPDGVEVRVYPTWDQVPLPAPSDSVQALLRDRAARSQRERREWVGCAFPGFAQVVDSPAQVQGTGVDARARTALCPPGLTLVHTHLDAWDTRPSPADCHNLAARRAPYDVIVMADSARLVLVAYRRC